MKYKHLMTLLAGIMLIGLASCQYSTIVPEEVVIPDEPVSYSVDVEPLFTTVNCIQCHPTLMKPDLRVGKSYASITSMNLVVAEKPEESKLWEYIKNRHNSAASLTATQKALIEKWITEGAKNN